MDVAVAQVATKDDILRDYSEQESMKAILKKSKPNLTWLIVVFVLLIDQLSKLAVVSNMFEYESISLLNGTFYLTYIKNSGIAFGILPEFNSVYAVSALIIACSIMVFMWFQKGKLNKVIEVGLYLIVSGALGNIIDRLVHEYVIDFIEFGFVNFAVFNIADIAITLGAIICILSLLFEKNDEA